MFVTLLSEVCKRVSRAIGAVAGELLLEGKKTIDSRFSINRIAPYSCVVRDDLILTKAFDALCGSHGIRVNRTPIAAPRARAAHAERGWAASAASASTGS